MSASTVHGQALGARLRRQHEQLLEMVPELDRIACALYDPSDDLLKTFVNSTRSGEPIQGYEFRLSESASLSRLAREFANLRDFETGAHLERMAHYARLIARELQASHGLSDETVEHLFLFAPLHDIGKIGIPDSILLKPGRLTPEERAVMETHVEKGVAVLDRLIGEFGMEDLPDSAVMRNVVAGHHECLDGSGYPQGLQGDQIPLEARIIAVADVLDALTSHRPYKQPWTIEEAIAELQRLVEVGKFDADCVAAVERQREAVQEIRDRFRDSEDMEP